MVAVSIDRSWQAFPAQPKGGTLNSNGRGVLIIERASTEFPTFLYIG